MPERLSPDTLPDPDSTPHDVSTAPQGLVVEPVIDNQATLDAVLAATNKSSALIANLLDGLNWSVYPHSANVEAILESLLGMRLEVDRLTFLPCIPANWTQFKLTYRYRKTPYHITVIQAPAGTVQRTAVDVTLDGIGFDGGYIPLIDDGVEHAVDLQVVSAAPPALPAVPN